MIDGVKKKNTAGAQDTPYFKKDAVEILHMFKHIDADDDVVRAVGEWQALAAPDAIGDFQLVFLCASARRIHCSFGGIDASDDRAALRQGRGHETAPAAKIEHREAAPVAN